VYKAWHQQTLPLAEESVQMNAIGLTVSSTQETFFFFFSSPFSLLELQSLFALHLLNVNRFS